MSGFLLEFEDLEPSLRSTQAVDFENLDEAVANVTVAFREIVADHLRHGKTLTMTSVVIRNEDHIVLAKLSIGDILWDVLAGARPLLKYPSNVEDAAHSTS